MAESSSEGPSAFDSPMQARTPGRDIFGPLDDHLPEVRIPADVKLDAMRAASAAGLDLTAYLRLNLYVSLYGVEHVTSMHREQLSRVLGNARQGASDGGLPAFLKAGARA